MRTRRQNRLAVSLLATLLAAPCVVAGPDSIGVVQWPAPAPSASGEPSGPQAGPFGSAQGKEKGHSLELLQTAHTMFVQRDFEGARKYYLQVLSAYPKNVDILKNLAFCYYRLRNFSEAAKYYAQALEVNPNSPEVAEKLLGSLTALKRHAEAGTILVRIAQLPGAPPQMWKEAAEQFVTAKQIDEAEKAYDAYLQRNPGDLSARVALGNLYARHDHLDEALAQFRLALSTSPNFQHALVGMARVLAWQGQQEESLRLYDRALRLNPQSGEARAGRAFLLLWMERYEEAYPQLKELRRRYPNDGDIARALGSAESALERKSFEEARRTGDVARLDTHYRQQLAKDPKDLVALKSLATFTANAQQCNESISFSRRGLEISPDDSQLQLTLGRALALCAQYEDAAASYRRFLETQQKAQDSQNELGRILLRSRRADQAAEVFRNVLQVNPKNTDAQMGLAQAHTQAGNFAAARAEYDAVLADQPESYDAQQGKAFILFWTKDLAGARALFEKLAAQRPDDAQNTQALTDLARAEEEAYWAALRPASADAPPEAWLQFYEKRLARYPDDLSAAKGRAYALSQMRNIPAAIEAYQNLLSRLPEDRGAKTELARLLSWDHRYDAAISLYRDLVAQSGTEPGGAHLREDLARVYVWAGRHAEARPVYEALLAQDPSNASYRLELARAELRLQEFAAAREGFTAVLAADPASREARLALARLDLREGKRESALQHFLKVLEQEPANPEALIGRAQLLYLQGELSEARQTVSAVLVERPESFDAIFLKANIESALKDKKEALAMLDRAEKLSPGNPEVAQMREKVRRQTQFTLRTSASYAREIGAPESLVTRLTPEGLVLVPNPIHADLKMFSYSTALGFTLGRRTDALLSFLSSPTSSPPSGVGGVAAPAQILYRQTTRLTPKLTLRGGIGVVRFGPGDPHILPGQTQVGAPPEPIATATSRVIGQGGFSFIPNKKLSFDFDASRSAIPYTPTSARFGVVQNRFNPGVNILFNARTELRLDYSYNRFSTDEFDHVTLVNAQRVVESRSESLRAHVASVTFDRNLYASDRFSFTAGFRTLFYAFSEGLYIGIFSPEFYQVHQPTLRFWGKLVGPVSYEVSGAIGVRQSGQGSAWLRTASVNPAFTIKVSERLALTLSYSHYNSSQALGTLRGNSARVTAEWRF